MVENVVGVIGKVEAGSFRRYYSLFFTNERIIRALTVGALKRFAMSQLPMGEVAEHFYSNFKAGKRTNQLKDLDSEEILRADKTNLSILYSTIQAIEMKKPGRLKGAKIKIVTNDKEHKFDISEKKKFDSYVEMVTSAIPEKLILT